MSCFEAATGPCSRRAMPGTTALAMHVIDNSPFLAPNGIYNCRPPRGAASGFSTHAEGRAFDTNAALPNGHPDPSPIPPGSPADASIRSWITEFVEHAEPLGIQRMLYKTLEWRCDRGFTKASSALAKLHANHLHVEQTRLKSRMLTTAQIRLILGEDDMFTDADRAALKALTDKVAYLTHVQDDIIRPKLDAVYGDTHADDHPELLAGRVKALAEGTAPPKVV